MSPNKQFFLGTQYGSTFVTDNSNYSRRFFYNRPRCFRQHIKPKSFESRLNSFSTRCGRASCLRACLDAILLPQSYQYPDLSEGADSVGGVTSSGRVWSKMPESGDRNVVMDYSVIIIMTNCCPWWRQLLWGPSASAQNDTTFRRKKKILNLPESPSSPCSLKMTGEGTHSLWCGDTAIV